MSTEPTGRIHIRMERSFDDFDATARNEFLADLGELSGCERERITRISYQRGCVIFNASMDRAAIERLVEFFEKLSASGPGAAEVSALREFVAKHRISAINDHSPCRLTIAIAPGSDARKLVFVHGWRGDGKSFGQLPRFLGDALGCATLVYEFPTGLWQHSPSLEFVSRNLENWLRNHAGGARLALVAHSMGGVLARKMIVDQHIRDEPLDVNFRQLTFVASPHRGTGLAALLRHFQVFRHQQPDEISPNSPFLLNLTEYWQHWMRQHVPATCRTRCIYGTADKIVPIASAADDKDSIPILNAGHIDIVKPARADAEIVLTIARLIRESGF